MCGIFPIVYNSRSGRPARFLCEGVFLNTSGHIDVAKAIFMKWLPLSRLLAKGRMFGTYWMCNAVLNNAEDREECAVSLLSNVQNPYCQRANELITAFYKREQ